MKKIYLLLLYGMFALQTVSAQTQPNQAKGYYFITKTGVALEDMSSASTLIGPKRADDQVSALTPMSFDFKFINKTFNAFQAYSSGTFTFANLGQPAASDFQLLFPFSAEELITGDNGHISYKVIGAANRKLVIEFFMSKYVASSNFPAIADKKYQVWLFENSNEIQFVYGDGQVNGVQAVVGIAGSYITDDLLQINTVSNTISTNPNYLSTNWPGVSLSYVFGPAPISAIVPTASISTAGNTAACAGSSVLLQAGLQDGTATAFQWIMNGDAIAGATNNNFAATESGTYSVQVSYNDGAATSSTIPVFITNLSGSVSSNNISCNANGNGSIVISNAVGGNNPFEYRLGNGMWQSETVFGGLAAGNYAVQMRSGECVKSLGSFTILDTRVSPVVSIISDNGGACANVTLSANPANAGSYTWSNGATGQNLILGNSDADGNYTVTVGNGVGCSGSATYVYNKQNQLNSYVIIASKSVSLGENNTVNGAIGNTGTLPVYLDKNTVVNSFIRSSSVKLNGAVTVTGAKVLSAPTVKLPTIYTNTSVTAELPELKLNESYSGTLNANYKKLEIGKKANVVLSGKIYGEIIVKEGAVVTFASADISIDDIKTEDGIKNATSTTLNFASGTIIRIKNKMEIGKRNKVNAAGSTFYLADLKKDDEKATVDANTVFSGNIIMPNGRLTVKSADENSPTVMTGAFICEIVVSDKYVTWNRNVCNVFAPRATAAIVPAITDKSIELNVYPNPANGKFNLLLKSSKAITAEIFVTDASGVQVHRQLYSIVAPGASLPVNLTNQPNGVYLLKVTTDEGSKTMKVMIKK